MRRIIIKDGKCHVCEGKQTIRVFDTRDEGEEFLKTGDFTKVEEVVDDYADVSENFENSTTD